MDLTISLGQFDVVRGDPEANLAKARQMTREAALRGSGVVVFPELWSTGFDLQNAARYACDLEQGVFVEVARLAREFQIHIVGSNLSVVAPGKCGNTATLFTPQGQMLGAYSKIHLFHLMDEHLYLIAGDRLALLDTPWGKTGLAICYDLRFPELFRTYALAGARLVFLPAAWPHPRLAHWQILLRARAIENQMYVVACNRVGKSGKYDFFGHSCVIDPWGEVCIESGEDETLLNAKISMDMVTEAREKIPVFRDRRPEFYKIDQSGII